MADVRNAFRVGAAAVMDAVARSDVTRRADDPSALPGMRIGALAAHLARAVTVTADYLDEARTSARPPATADERAADELLDGPGYFASVDGLNDRGSEINRQVVERAEAASEQGPAVVVARTAAAIDRIEATIDEVPATLVVTVLGGRRITIDEYLRTRCVEIAVHLDDLAVSLDTEIEIPEPTAIVAAEVLASLAVLQRGGPATLRALGRGERATVPVFPVF